VPVVAVPVPAVMAPAVTAVVVLTSAVIALSITVRAGLVPAAPVVAGASGERKTAHATNQRRATSDCRNDARAAISAVKETEESSS